MTRPTKLQSLISMAQVVAERGTCDRLKVGSVIVRDGRVISTGYNGNVSGALHCHHWEDDQPCTSAVHAEANAIVFAARHGVATEGASLFTTHQPCESCAKLIINSGLVRVYFMYPYRLREGLEMLIKCESVEVFGINPVDYSLYQMTR